MGRPKGCADRAKEGYAPSSIADELGISCSSVVRYLYVAVGKGLVRLSDILLTIPLASRVAIDQAVDDLGTTCWYYVREPLAVSPRPCREEIVIFMTKDGGKREN